MDYLSRCEAIRGGLWTLYIAHKLKSGKNLSGFIIAGIHNWGLTDYSNGSMLSYDRQEGIIGTAIPIAKRCVDFYEIYLQLSG